MTDKTKTAEEILSEVSGLHIETIRDSYSWAVRAMESFASERTKELVKDVDMWRGKAIQEQTKRKEFEIEIARLQKEKETNIALQLESRKAHTSQIDSLTLLLSESKKEVERLREGITSLLSPATPKEEVKETITPKSLYLQVCNNGQCVYNVSNTCKCTNIGNNCPAYQPF